MKQAHGYAEYRQVDEWYGVIDVGALLVPNSRLSSVLLDVAESRELSAEPPEPSVAFEQRYAQVRGHVSGTATFSYEQALTLREHGVPGMQPSEVATLFNETLFDTLLDLCGVLARRFGADNVRIALYFD